MTPLISYEKSLETCDRPCM